MASLPAGSPGDRPRYRVEHRTDAGTAIVPCRLAEFRFVAEALEEAGAGGVLMVVDETTGRVRIARRLIPAAGKRDDQRGR